MTNYIELHNGLRLLLIMHGGHTSIYCTLITTQSVADISTSYDDQMTCHVMYIMIHIIPVITTINITGHDNEHQVTPSFYQAINYYLGMIG